MNEEFEKYQEMAKAYLTKKERKNYYESKGICEPYADYACMLVELSDEEVSMIRPLKEQYGEDFVHHLKEVYEDDDTISDMFYGEPVGIDLENTYHQYRFTIREVNDEKVSSRQILIQLTDEEYCKLLAWHLYDSHLVLNTLFYRDEQLCKRIMRESMRYFEDELGIMCSNPFVLTMDEAIADMEQILKDNNLEKDSAYRVLPV
jgi:hypothetical protein